MSATLINELHARAQAALANSPFFELHELQVEQRDGTLFISGNVTSFLPQAISTGGRPFGLQRD